MEKKYQEIIDEVLPDCNPKKCEWWLINPGENSDSFCYMFKDKPEDGKCAQYKEDNTNETP